MTFWAAAAVRRPRSPSPLPSPQRRGSHAGRATNLRMRPIGESRVWPHPLPIGEGALSFVARAGCMPRFVTPQPIVLPLLWGEGRGEGDLGLLPCHSASSSEPDTLQTRFQFLVALGRRSAPHLNSYQRTFPHSAKSAPTAGRAAASWIHHGALSNDYGPLFSALCYLIVPWPSTHPNPLPVSRFPFPVSRFTLHASRFRFQVSSLPPQESGSFDRPRMDVPFVN